MAKFVIAGKADCPYFAKAELLADYLQRNLPDFRVHKIIQHPDVWKRWLRDLCKKNQWNHKRSPIIWRELLDRGGKGLLLGGVNEFLEHVQLYYGITSKMMTNEMLIIASENLETHIEIQQEKEEIKSVINPIKVWITGASCPTSYNLIPILVNGEVFGEDKEISIHLLNNNFNEDGLHGTMMEAQDLAAPLLRNISMCTAIEEAFVGAEVIIILNDDIENEFESLENRIRARLPLCQLFGSLIEKNAHKSVKVIVAGKTFLNLTTNLIITYTPSLNPRNVIAVAMVLENEAKAMLARKMKTTASDIKDVIIWGNITGSRYIDLRKAKVFRYNSAIWGPPSFSRYVLNLIFDSEWIRKEFEASLNSWSLTRYLQRGVSSAHCIATVLKFWYHNSPPGEILSMGIISEGEFGIPQGIVFSMPVQCENGIWFPRMDLTETELTEEIKSSIIHDLQQEKLIALGEISTYQPYLPVAGLTPRENRVRIHIEENLEEDQKDHTEFFSVGSLDFSEGRSSQEPVEGNDFEFFEN
ncbi:putative malate dehydrogenase 1B [Antechinus flavipes]|uniref:putative malate dehydrogenase 1B n=1 Tax=Antechinus flavipes TaxID=38775 RepID=UPI002236832A|nr:putative malate dehydrogenase 1B [Antechinus flavipes]